MAKVSPVTDNTVFFRVSFGLPGNTKKIPVSKIAGNEPLAAQLQTMQDGESAPTNQAKHDYDARLVKAQKTLLESPELDAIRKSDNQLRSYIDNMCLPWSMGARLLPIQFLEDINSRCAAYSDERSELVESFLTVYPTRRDAAIASLGSLGNLADYPSVEKMRSKFYFDYEYQTVSLPEVLKEKGLYDIANEKLQARLKDASEEITAYMRETLFELTSHLQDVLTPNADGKPKRLFSSAITNIQDFLDTFEARNITNDSELEDVVNELKRSLTGSVYADGLKKDVALKDQIKQKMTDVSERLKELVEVIPSRKIRDEV